MLYGEECAQYLWSDEQGEILFNFYPYEDYYYINMEHYGQQYYDSGEEMP